MKNLNKSLFLPIVFAFFFIAGCDQKVPLDLSLTLNVSGTAYEYDYLRNSVNRDKKIENAVISLSGPVNVSTVTASDGAYSFTGVPLGKYALSATKEGFERNGKTVYSAQYDLSNSAAGSWQTIDLDLDPRPALLGASVQDDQEISNSIPSIKFYFSEAISEETATGFIKKIALRSAAASISGYVLLSVSWEADGRTMVLTPGRSLDADAIYQVGLCCSDPDLGIKGVLDLQKNPIYGTQLNDYSINNYATDAHYGTYYYVPFKTISDKTARPAAPTGLYVRSSYSGSAEVDYTSVYASNSGVALSFNASAGANGYRLYVSADGTNYVFAKEFSTPSVFVFVSDVVAAFGSSVAVGYDTYGYPIEPGLPWPFLGGGIYFKVSAYNSLGESDPSSPLQVVDTANPTVNATAVSESGTVKVIKFSESLDRASAENKANYALQGAVPPTILSATLINDFSYAYQPYKTTFVRLVLSATDAGPRTVRINGVKDLTGNQIAANTDVAY